MTYTIQTDLSAGSSLMNDSKLRIVNSLVEMSKLSKENYETESISGQMKDITTEWARNSMFQLSGRVQTCTLFWVFPL